MAKTKVYNCTDSPVVLSDGSVIGGREHRTVASVTPDVQAHLKSGRLVQVRSDESGPTARKTGEK